MQVDNRLLDDLARLASSTLGSLAGVKEEIDALVRQRLERLLADMELVRRDEFEAVKAVAANARAAEEDLEARLSRLEKTLAEAQAARAGDDSIHKT
ncbi:MAG: accessory factor UbiK family protein [Alphaproteobacteria bacterium]